MSILDELGLDAEEVRWQDLAACKNVVQTYVNEDGEEVLFDPLFDSYEEDESPYSVRRATDEMCMACPVQRMCFDYGVDNAEPGVWGGVYLMNGHIDRTRNEHKTDEVWKRIREVIYE